MMWMMMMIGTEDDDGEIDANLRSDCVPGRGRRTLVSSSTKSITGGDAARNA